MHRGYLNRKTKQNKTPAGSLVVADQYNPDQGKLRFYFIQVTTKTVQHVIATAHKETLRLVLPRI